MDLFSNIIILEYKNSHDNDLIFPVISNQRINRHLKEFATICGINKKLTFHSARHTFATTITLIFFLLTKKQL